MFLINSFISCKDSVMKINKNIPVTVKIRAGWDNDNINAPEIAKICEQSGADLITVHAEACRHLDRTISAIKEKGLLAGVALNPATPLSSIEWILPKVDMVLIMSVNPGFGGQSMIPYCIDKVRELKAMIDAKGLKTDIEVDGGVNHENVKDFLDAGANIIVAGSAVFNGDIAGNVEKFLEILGA